MAEHPNVARIRDGWAAFAKGDFAVLNVTARVMEFWNASTDQYAYDEVIG
jgi:hypothetical protein